MTRTRKTMSTLLAAGALCVGLAPAAWADASPPTNGGNGAGGWGRLRRRDRPALA